MHAHDACLQAYAFHRCLRTVFRKAMRAKKPNIPVQIYRRGSDVSRRQAIGAGQMRQLSGIGVQAIDATRRAQIDAPITIFDKAPDLVTG